MGLKSNEELLLWLRGEKWQKICDTGDNNSVSYRRMLYRLHDRLSEQEIDMLVIDFMSGIAKHKLAERYGINIKSVKKLLKERGATRGRWERAA